MKLTAEHLDALTSIGLDPSGLRVYAALLELGEAEASIIARRAQMQRTTAYSALKRLIDTGLVGITRSSGSRRFIPSSPEVLVRRAEDEAEHAKTALAATKELALALKKSRRKARVNLTKVQVYEGKRAIEGLLYEQQSSWRQSMLERKTSWLGFQDDSFLRTYGEWVKDYWDKFKDAPDAEHEQLRLFCNVTPVEMQVAQQVGLSARGRRILRELPAGITFSSTIWVIGEFLVTLKTRTSPHIAMVIQDVDLCENLAGVFLFLWKMTDTSALKIEERP
jgi:predicted transcriptional regulator